MLRFGHFVVAVVVVYAAGNIFANDRIAKRESAVRVVLRAKVTRFERAQFIKLEAFYQDQLHILKCMSAILRSIKGVSPVDDWADVTLMHLQRRSITATDRVSKVTEQLGQSSRAAPRDSSAVRARREWLRSDVVQPLEELVAGPLPRVAELIWV